MNRTIVMPNSVNTTIATYNNVGPGVYLFVLTGDYHPTTGVPVTPDPQYWNTYFTPSNINPTHSTLAYCKTTVFGVYLNGTYVSSVSMSAIFNIQTTPTTLYLISSGSVAPATTTLVCSYSLCKLA